MIITIRVSADRVLQAINKGFKAAGRPDTLDDPKYIDEQDIATYIVPLLGIEDELDAIEIERD